MKEQWIEAIAQAEEQRTIEIMSGGKTPEALRKLVRNAHETSDALVADRWEQITGTFLACQPGCGFCCKYRIQASPPEVLVIADYLKGQLRGVEHDDFMSRLHGLANEAVNTDVFGWGTIGHICPLLLSTERCSIYALRPFICRSWHSFSLENCHRGDCICDSYAYTIPLRILDGLERGLADAGLQGEPVELITGLDEVMGDSEAAKDWLAGRRVFGRSADIAKADSLRVYEDINRAGSV